MCCVGDCSIYFMSSVKIIVPSKIVKRIIYTSVPNRILVCLRVPKKLVVLACFTMSKLKMNQRVPNKNADLLKKISLMGTEIYTVQNVSLSQGGTSYWRDHFGAAHFVVNLFVANFTKIFFFCFLLFNFFNL